jgi:hypothetical protein
MITSEEISVLGIIKIKKRAPKSQAKGQNPTNIAALERENGRLKTTFERLARESAEKSKNLGRVTRENATLKEHLVRIIKAAEQDKDNNLKISSSTKSTVYYLTTPNICFNRVLAKPMPALDAYQNFYMELQFNLMKSLVNPGDDIRISIMRHNHPKGCLEIVSKLGTFNKSTGEMSSKKGSGLSWKCLNEGVIINIGNNNSNMDPIAKEVALNEGVPPNDPLAVQLSLLYIPIFLLERTAGIIKITSTKENAFVFQDELMGRLYAQMVSRVWAVEDYRKKK